MSGLPASDRSQARVRRELKLLGGCNRLLIQAGAEPSLLVEFCRLIVDAGGYRFAWVGFAEHDPEKSVRPVASAGPDAEYLERTRISWGDGPIGLGPTGRAIRTRHPEICRNSESDPLFAPWQSEARRFEHRSSIALPIVSDEDCLGALNIYSDRPDAFDDSEVLLLEELSRDLAYGIGALRTRAEGRRHREQLERLARILRMQSGVNSAVLRIRDRDELLREACRLATEVGGYDRAVMVVVDEAGRKAVPRFRTGAGSDFPEPEEFDLTDALAANRSLSCRALRTGVPALSLDLSRAEPPVAMRERLVELGYKAMVALPLVAEGRRVAAMVLVTRNPSLVADDELLVLLQDMMASLSFAMRSREQAEAVQYLAYYDPLTGLAKRSRFAERFDELVRPDAASPGGFAVVAFDLRGLNRINDTFGRHVGDAILREVADRLRRHARGAELAAHLGGGAFALVEPPLAGDESIRSVLNANLFSEPIEIEGRSLRVSASYGVAHFPQDGLDVGTLLQRAEAALKLAKESGTSYLHYRLEMHSEIAERLHLEHKLSTAIAEEQFELHYQAQLDPATDRIVAVEALLRWNDPETGLVAPGRFLHVLESTGMILPVGEWALTRAVEDCEGWARRGIAPVRVGVNVSAVQLRQRAFVAKALELGLRLARAQGYGLELEITESTLLQDPEGARRMLGELRNAGIRIALDDFGTGYSSLGLLSKLPVDALKIDQSFVQGIPHDVACVAIVENVVRLASAFRLMTIVEGVETREQLEAVKSMRCDRWQGFLHGRAVPASEMERELATG